MAKKKVEPRPPSQLEEHRAALFAGVKESPDDDTPRLILADWLEENGDDDDRTHAELIRIQCEADRRAAELIDPTRPEPIHALLRMVGYHNNILPHDFFGLTRPDERLKALKQRANEITRRWHDEHRIAVMPTKRLASWNRGFADLHLRDVTFKSRDMAALAGGPWGPRVDQMTLSLTASNVDQLARSEMFAHLSGLCLHGSGGGPEYEVLLASPHLAMLRRVDFFMGPRWDKLKAVITAPQHARLTHLYAYGHELDVAEYRKFAAAELPSLTSLHLGGTPDMGAAGAKALAGAGFLGHLKELILTNNGLGTKGMEALASGRHFRCPARLEVGSNEIGIAGLRALLAAPGLEDAVALELDGNDLDDAAVAELAASPRLSGLVSLDLRSNPKLGPAAAEAVASSPYLARLACLRMGGMPGEAGGQALLRSPHLRRLQLSANEKGMSEQTVAALGERFVSED